MPAARQQLDLISGKTRDLLHKEGQQLVAPSRLEQCLEAIDDVRRRRQEPHRRLVQNELSDPVSQQGRLKCANATVMTAEISPLSVSSHSAVICARC